MTSDQIANYLQVLRRKSGFSQSDLAILLGIVTESQVSRHERSATVPGLLAALAYVPLSGAFSLNASIAEHWLYLPTAFLFLAAAVRLRRNREPI